MAENIKLGSANITSIKLGSNEVDALYVGGNRIFPILEFILEFTTTQANEEVFLPYTNTGTYDGVVDWGEGDGFVAHSFSQSSNVYEVIGTYTVTIKGAVSSFSFGNNLNTSAALLTDITKFGDAVIESLAFQFGTGLTVVSATDTPVLTSSAESLFDECTNLTSVTNINSWNTTGVNDMSRMFRKCSNFNQAISFDTSNVTDMLGMFAACPLFNSSLTLNTGNVTNMQAMFNACTIFNQPINFDTSSVQIMQGMFGNAFAFNSPLNFSDTSNVNTMQNMFFGAIAFNQPINFNTSSVTTMQSMFKDARVFNQPLAFNTSSVTRMNEMFRDATAFDQDISSWDTSNVTRMNSMFDNATAFDQDISSWDFSSIISTGLEQFMFAKTSANYSSTNYDALLNKWALSSTLGGLQSLTGTITMGTIQYTAAGAASRAAIIAKGWTIIDGGLTI